MSVLARLSSLGVLLPLDLRVAEFLVGEGPAGWATALTSSALRAGHACLDLHAWGGRSFWDADAELRVELPSTSVWQSELARSDAVEVVEAGASGTTRRPLVLTGARLYFRRHFEHEQRLAAALAARMGQAPSSEPPSAAFLELHFPSSQGSPEQRRAAALALSQRFLIVSGGPGTGKTATVARILAMLGAQADDAGLALPRVLLLAPTGKAAARVKESIADARAQLGELGSRLEEMSREASTIHRALGVLPDNRTRFRRGPDAPLPHDVVVVDEASMVDLALMRHLVEALRPEARLILLGDRHQLASVEAGSVLSELWSAQGGVGPGESTNLVELLHSYRFDDAGGIGALSRAVREGAGARALELVDGREPRLRLLERSPTPQGRHEWLAQVRAEIVDGFAAVFQRTGAAEALSAMREFRVLAAHRRGPHGVETLNLSCREWLAQAGLVPGQGTFYRGRPILVTQNDAARGLYNGDVGLVWPDEQGKLVVHFETSTGLRRLPPAQLPEHESAFALTVHKSQGSEYERVLVVLPDENSGLLSRELLYTAVTRARSQVTLAGPRASIVTACATSLGRASGLAAALAIELTRP